MATDAQGRQLSEDGFYYWDGSEWQLVQQDEGGGAAESAGAEGEDEAAAGGLSDEIKALLKKLENDEDLTDEEYDKLAEADVGE